MDKAASRIRLQKTVSEISRIDFSFVTLFYCLYDICIVLFNDSYRT